MIFDQALSDKAKGGENCHYPWDVEPRYVIVDADTCEVLDDAQGYGYKSKAGAYTA